ncbi:unnamed protein product [Blepharisma stoltei]|uniref:NADH dehydrogenase subunit 1 n=1 Tax=Blepharisma stoltei TaxID=1481888 RepID=A0AAU9KRD6_9CILI|nr:unnamed protein product [Blepharisma stoltei]
MEEKATSIIIFLSFLILAYNWVLKLKFCILNWILYGSLVGLFLFWSLGIFLRRIDTKFNILANHGTYSQGLCSYISYNNNKFYLICGIIVGSYIGYNLSIIYSAYLELKPSIAFSYLVNSTGSIIMTLIMIGFENSKILRRFLPFCYPESCPWTYCEFLKSLYISISLGEYVGLMAMIYLGFFEVMYLLAYEIVIGVEWYFILGGVCLCCCSMTCIGYYDELQKRKKKQEKEGEVELDDIRTAV